VGSQGEGATPCSACAGTTAYQLAVCACICCIIEPSLILSEPRYHRLEHREYMWFLWALGHCLSIFCQLSVKSELNAPPEPQVKSVWKSTLACNVFKTRKRSTAGTNETAFIISL